MKRFSYDLEKLLELRSFEEKESELKLARANGELAALENQIKSLAEERSAAASERFAAGKSGADMRVSELYLLRLDRLKDKLLLESAKAELLVAAARETYREAAQKRKVLDKLRTKRLEAYKKAYMLEETKEIDDTAGRRRFHHG